MFRIVCCIKAVPTGVTGVKVPAAGTRAEYRSYSLTINETDEYALEEAIYLRKKFGGQVTVITAGSPACEEVLFRGLAKGADKAVRVEADSSAHALTALALANAIKRLPYNLILAGMESSDSMAAYVGISIALRLDLPFAFGVSKVEVGSKPDTLLVTKELGGGAQAVLEVTLPALLCIQSGIQSLSYMPVAKFIQARRQRLDCFKLTDLGITESDLKMAHWFKLVDVCAPKTDSAAQILSGEITELARVTMERIKEAL